jgi:hypothetical protein
MRRLLVPTAYFALGAAALGLVVLNVLAWSGGLVDEVAPKPAPKRVAPPPEPPPPPPPPPEPTVARRQNEPRSPSIVLTAVRGDCWLSVRVGAESGDVLYEGVLALGDSLRFKRQKLWLRLGAASNLEISVDGKPAEVPAGTVDVVLPPT